MGQEIICKTLTVARDNFPTYLSTSEQLRLILRFGLCANQMILIILGTEYVQGFDLVGENAKRMAEIDAQLEQFQRQRSPSSQSDKENSEAASDYVSSGLISQGKFFSAKAQNCHKCAIGNFSM